MDHFVPGLVALQKDYAWRLLRHVNPHTGRRYLDDPGVAVMEVNNENGMFWSFQHTMETWPAEYLTVLRARWNYWLLQREPDNAAAKSGKEPLVRFSDRGNRGRQVPVAAKGPGAELAVGPDCRTVWYEIAVDR